MNTRSRGSTPPGIREKIEGMFEGGYKLKFHLAPPIFNKPDRAHGGSAQIGVRRLDDAGVQDPREAEAAARNRAGHLRLNTEERKTERRLIAGYEQTVAELLARLDRENLKLAVEIASVPEHIRGFGHVKRRHLEEAKKKESGLLAAFRASRPSARAA